LTTLAELAARPLKGTTNVTCHHHPVCCILPPHLLERVASHGRTVRIREAAAGTLALSSSLASRRAHVLATARADQYAADSLRRPTPLARTIRDVHYGKRYDNAFYDGTEMCFGDGDGELFNRFTIALDVIAHELSHGVTGTTAGLDYHDQPGALNESVSDRMGVAVRQGVLGLAVDDPDGWLIGKGLLAEGVNGRALRDMMAPGTAYDDRQLGKDPQPDHMRGYVVGRSDNGGVHTNSGIPNKAFFLLATNLGDTLKAARVTYETLKSDDVPQGCSFPASAC
jgi:Zn-dependent metalloprotease